MGDTGGGRNNDNNTRNDNQKEDEEEGLLPWRLLLHFSEWPDEQLVRLDSEGKVLHDAFINSVKEADFLRNGTAKGIMSLSKDDSTRLWHAVEERMFSPFSPFSPFFLSFFPPFLPSLDSGHTFSSFLNESQQDCSLTMTTREFRLILSNLSEVTLRPRYAAPPYPSQIIPPFLLLFSFLCRQRGCFLITHEASIGWASASRPVSHHTHCFFWNKGGADLGISPTHVVARPISKSTNADSGEAGAAWVRGADGSTGGGTLEKRGLLGWLVAFRGCYEFVMGFGERGY